MKHLLAIAAMICISIAAFSQNGKIGINTTTPQAMLHVKDSSVLFAGAAVVPAAYGNPPVSGAGVRMMWYPDKAAFRAGSINTGRVDWDKDSIGVHSFAVGFNTRAKGPYSMATGIDNIVTGTAAIAMGELNEATGTGSVAMGRNARAHHNFAIAMGNSSRASGFSSVAIGDFNIASGARSVALGDDNNAIGAGAVALGSGTRAEGEISLSSGWATTANGKYSTTLGYRTEANAFASLVIGRYNVEAGDPENWIDTDPLFVIGNGISTSSNEHNAFIVQKNAMTGINIAAPLAALHIKGLTPSSYNSHIRLETEGSSTDYASITYDGDLKFRTFGLVDDYEWRNSQSNVRMRLTDAGNLSIAGTLSQSSDARLKTGIAPISNAMSMLQRLNGYHYLWKDSARGTALQTGLLAQEVEAVMPELVTTDNEGMKAVNYNGLIPYLIEANKELLQRVESLEKEVKRLKKSNRK